MSDIEYLKNNGPFVVVLFLRMSQMLRTIVVLTDDVVTKVHKEKGSILGFPSSFTPIDN